MGWYNVVVIPLVSPVTGESGEARIQYHWGACRGFEYRVGDTIRWEGGYDQVGMPGRRRVVEPGSLEQGPPEAPDDWQVYIIDDRIERVVPYSARFARYDTFVDAIDELHELAVIERSASPEELLRDLLPPLAGLYRAGLELPTIDPPPSDVELVDAPIESHDHQPMLNARLGPFAHLAIAHRGGSAELPAILDEILVAVHEPLQRRRAGGDEEAVAAGYAWQQLFDEWLGDTLVAVIGVLHRLHRDHAPAYPESLLVRAHAAATRNREELLASRHCGCFHCTAMFPPVAITSWVDGDERGEPTTALCPHCGVRAVIGSASGHPVTAAFLERMRRYWFAGVR